MAFPMQQANQLSAQGGSHVTSWEPRVCRLPGRSCLFSRNWGHSGRNSQTRLGKSRAWVVLVEPAAALEFSRRHTKYAYVNACCLRATLYGPDLRIRSPGMRAPDAAKTVCQVFVNVRVDIADHSMSAPQPQHSAGKPRGGNAFAMAAVMDLQRQLQDHSEQLAQLSQQLQNMESLLRCHEDHGKGAKSPTEEERPRSCSTDLEMERARWETLAHMLELEEHARARDVADLKMLLEDLSNRTKQDVERASGWEASVSALRAECSGWFCELTGRLSSQEAAVQKFKRPDAANAANVPMCAEARLPCSRPNSRVPPVTATPQTVPTPATPAKMAAPEVGAGAPGRLTRSHTATKEAFDESRSQLGGSQLRTTQRSLSPAASPISRNAYARLGSCGKGQSLYARPEEVRTPMPPMPAVAVPLFGETF
ncbi:unnamed protein product [Effrenium voratum]|nr:unnamed protein product [Effrenium voratum]